MNHSMKTYPTGPWQSSEKHITLLALLKPLSLYTLLLLLSFFALCSCSTYFPSRLLFVVWPPTLAITFYSFFCLISLRPPTSPSLTYTFTVHSGQNCPCFPHFIPLLRFFWFQKCHDRILIAIPSWPLGLSKILSA